MTDSTDIDRRMELDPSFADGFRAAIDANFYDLTRNQDIAKHVEREMVLDSIEHQVRAVLTRIPKKRITKRLTLHLVLGIISQERRSQP